MLIKKGFICYVLFILIVILILICILAAQKVETVASVDYKAPIYKISTSESTQLDIWKLCEENHLSYTLVLAIFQIEGFYEKKIDKIQAKIEKLAYYRNYWSVQGYPDEDVFVLMLFYEQREIEDSKNFTMNNYFYTPTNYVQKVTECKYYLDQSLNAQPVIEK